jgi:hypothetical protein
MSGESRCPDCGSVELMHELRCGALSADPARPLARNSYGSWIVCLECLRQWPDSESEEPQLVTT